MRYNRFSIRMMSGLLALLFVSVAAELKAQVYVGYCKDEISTTGIGNSNVDATVSCAAAFTPTGVFEPYPYCELFSMRVGLSATEGIASFRVWVREHLSSENLAEFDVPVENLEIGWNEIVLPAAISLASYDTLYCGYDYTQSQKNVRLVSHNGAKRTPLSFWIANNGKWRDYTSSYGPVSIRAGISPICDNAIRLVDLSLDRRSQPFRPDGTGYERVTITYRVHNLGRLEYEGAAFGSQVILQQSFVPGQGVVAPMHDIAYNFVLAKPNDDPEAVVIDGDQTLYYDLYDSTLLQISKLNILEEFTSERCGFAPLGQQRLREAVAQSSKNFVILSHHEGFGPADAWRVTRKTDYNAALFGPDKLTFAPAGLLNREGQPFSTTLAVDSLVSLLDEASFLSIASLAVEASLSNGKIEAKVTAEPYVLTYCQNPQLVLCLVQDEVASVEQKNYYPSDVDADYQRDVIRCFLHNESGTDDLLQGVNMDDIMSGKGSVSDAVAMIDGKMVFAYSASVPSDITDLKGLTLVAYVYDQGNDNQIVAAYCTKY